ncbi:MAG: hypothetical protein IPK13_26065 [Deltaproteobacteria bacterium]|nr:hypothetical protein [Deltaproteobacteria bacterium]
MASKRFVLASTLIVVLLDSATAPAAPMVGNGRWSLPGVNNVTAAAPMERGLAASFTTGY